MKTKEVAKTQKKWTVLSEAPKEVFDCLKDYPRAIVQVLWNRGILQTTNVRIQNESTNIQMDTDSGQARMTEKTNASQSVILGTKGTPESGIKKDTDSGQARMTKEIENFLEPDYETNLLDPYLLKDMNKAVERILKAIENKDKICVYGDYDVDGITATALLANLFEKLEADFMTYIPSRQDEGYGLNKDAIDEMAKSNVKLIITVDCGIRSFDEIDYANSLELDVIVTDHHEMVQKSEVRSRKSDTGDTLPNAIAVVNPKRSDCNYPFKDLAGVGVAFKLACAVLAKGPSLSKGWEKWMLDLVALGTVCDIVPLIGENRVLAKYGLKVLTKTKREGIKALVKSAGIDIEKIDSHNLGFHLGPRLNASGRLEHAKMSLDLLLSKDEAEVEGIALKLSKLNKERQDLTNKILEEAREMLGGIDDRRNIILLKNKNWPAGVVGIVASKLMDECGKPVLLMEEGDSESKGSARSIDGFNIIEALQECEEFLVKYGGHKKAAGLTIKNEHFIVLNDKLIELANGKISEEDLLPEIMIDSELTAGEIKDDLNTFLKKLEPFGFENKKPIFLIKNAELKNISLVGNEKNHLKLSVKDGNDSLSGILFNYGKENGFRIGEKVDLVFTVSENEWNGRVNLEARLLDIRSARQTN